MVTSQLLHPKCPVCRAEYYAQFSFVENAYYTLNPKSYDDKTSLLDLLTRINALSIFVCSNKHIFVVKNGGTITVPQMHE